MKEEKINLLMTGVDSIDGYQADVLERIDSKLHFRKCILTQIVHDDKDRYDSGKYRTLNYDMCAHCTYGEFYDFNRMRAIPKELAEAMAPYETDAMHMLQRRYNFDIMTFDEQRRYYLQHLQFWYNIFEEEQVNYVVLTNIPHHAFDYIIYALAKIYKVRLCVFNVTVVYHYFFACSSLENAVIKVDYGRNDGDIALLPDLERYYQAKKYQADVDLTGVELPQKEHILMQRRSFFSDIDRSVVRRRYFAKWKHGVKVLLREKDAAVLKKNLRDIKEDREYVKRARRKLKDMTSIERYNKLACAPDYKERYVIFFLHLQPEASTLPMAGIFTEQILALRILSEALRGTGISLYVKEHFVQPCREKYFYEDIMKLEGARLINCFEDSKKLIAHSAAVATCTGTAMLEAIINGRPVLAFGNSMLNSAEGVYAIGSTQQCRAVLQKVTGPDYRISQTKVRQFLKAFGEQTTKMYIYLNEVDGSDSLTIEESKRNLADAVAGWYRRQE